MAQPRPMKHLVPKHKLPATQPETQTAKANATPRVGQGTRKRSAYHQAVHQASNYAGVSSSYNVGRTRRANHTI